MLTWGSLAIFLAGILFVSADYGIGAPKLIIKEAGPSKHYSWVGYTHHYPNSVPRPLLLYKWHPYMDPTYTAFWVTRQQGGGHHGGGYSGGGGHSGGHHGGGFTEGRIPHGFGAPKPSSVTGGGFHGGHDVGVSSFGDEYSSGGGASFGGHAGPVHAGPVHAGPVHAEPVHIEPVYAGPVHAGPVHPGPVHAGPVHAGPVHPEPVPTAHHSGPTIHQEVTPLVQLPHSDPLPLENEGTYFGNSILGGGLEAHGAVNNPVVASPDAHIGEQSIIEPVQATLDDFIQLPSVNEPVHS